jgi:tripartite-type tricarboxylate transporter receptor subunit TctC
MKRADILKNVFAAVLAACLPLNSAFAQNKSYPERPVRFILGFPAGGASDILGRALAQNFTERWGQQFVVDNRPGATGVIASTLAAQASPDGYTVLLISSSYTNSAILKKKLPFEPFKDLVPVSKAAIVPNIAVVYPSFPVKSIQDLIAYAKSNPGKVNYASGGAGTGTHLATELLKMMTGINLVHIPYKGTPPALTDIMAGRVQLMLAGAPPALPHIQAGKLRAIAVTSAKRSPSLPDVPAIAETVPGYEATTWYGVMVPAKTPKKIIAALNSQIAQALQSPDVLKILSRAGFEAESSSPENFHAFMKAEYEKWSKVIKAAHITAD